MNKKPVSPLALALRESFGKSCRTKKGTFIHAYNKDVKAAMDAAESEFNEGFMMERWKKYFQEHDAKYAHRHSVLPMLQQFGRGLRMGDRETQIDLIVFDEAHMIADPELARKLTERFMLARVTAPTDEREAYLDGTWNVEGM